MTDLSALKARKAELAELSARAQAIIASYREALPQPRHTRTSPPPKAQGAELDYIRQQRAAQIASGGRHAVIYPSDMFKEQK